MTAQPLWRACQKETGAAHEDCGAWNFGGALKQRAMRARIQPALDKALERWDNVQNRWDVIDEAGAA